MAANPSSDQILKSVYKVTTNYVSKSKSRKMNESLMEQALGEVARSEGLGMEVSDLDNQMKESVQLAKEMMEKCKIVN